AKSIAACRAAGSAPSSAGLRWGQGAPGSGRFCARAGRVRSSRAAIRRRDMVVLPGVSGFGSASDGAGLGQDAVDEGLGGAEIVGRVGEAVDGGGVEVGGDGGVLEEGFG